MKGFLLRRIRDRLQRDTQGLDHLSHRLQQRHPGRRLDDLIIKVNIMRQSIDKYINYIIIQQQRTLRDLARTLHAVSPLKTIGRGYAVVTSAQTGKVISSVSQAPPGESITTQLSDGRLLSTVDKVTDQTLDSGES